MAPVGEGLGLGHTITQAGPPSPPSLTLSQHTMGNCFQAGGNRVFGVMSPGDDSKTCTLVNSYTSS